MISSPKLSYIEQSKNLPFLSSNHVPTVEFSCSQNCQCGCPWCLLESISFIFLPLQRVGHLMGNQGALIALCHVLCCSAYVTSWDNDLLELQDSLDEFQCFLSSTCSPLIWYSASLRWLTRSIAIILPWNYPAPLWFIVWLLHVLHALASTLFSVVDNLRMDGWAWWCTLAILIVNILKLKGCKFA